MPAFQGLGSLGDPYGSSMAARVSADGTTVVGQCSRSSGLSYAFRWTAADGMIALRNNTGGVDPWFAHGVSGDGEVIVGEGRFETLSYGFHWRSNQDVRSTYRGAARAVSADGIVTVGNCEMPGIGQFAYRWTVAGGGQLLGDLPGGADNSIAYDTSDDGTVIVGRGNSNYGGEAFVWSASGGIAGLGDLPGGAFSSSAAAVSGNGRFAVGNGTSASGPQACVWDLSVIAPAGVGPKFDDCDRGIQGLGDLPGGSFHSVALDISDDGTIIVGAGRTTLGDEAFIWDAEHGMRNLREVLVDEYSLSLNDWMLTSAEGISANGRIIVGTGINPAGRCEAWRAVIPEPGTIGIALLLLFGCLRSAPFRHS